VWYLCFKFITFFQQQDAHPDGRSSNHKKILKYRPQKELTVPVIDMIKQALHIPAVLLGRKKSSLTKCKKGN